MKKTQHNTKKKALVTGATGLIGSNILLRLAQAGQEIKAITHSGNHINKVNFLFNFCLKDGDKLFKTIKWVKGSILDKTFLENEMKYTDHVYHCAGKVSFSPDDKEKLNNINVKGTEVVIECCKNRSVKKLCHISSMGALKHLREKEKKATNKALPYDSPYEKSKYISEKKVWKAIDQGLNAIIVNPAVVLGPPLWGNGSNSLFTSKWNNWGVYIDGKSNFIDVRDVTKAMFKLMNREYNEKQFALSAQSMSYKEIIELIAEAMGRRRPVFRLPGYVLNFIQKAGKIKYNLLGDSPFIPEELLKNINSSIEYQGNGKDIIKEYIPIKKSVEFNSRVYFEYQKQYNKMEDIKL